MLVSTLGSYTILYVLVCVDVCYVVQTMHVNVYKCI